MKEIPSTTAYFTFGQNHIHPFNGHTLDKNCVIKVSSINPRQNMFEWFGPKWAFEYPEKPEMKYFPRGIYNANTNNWEK